MRHIIFILSVFFFNDAYAAEYRVVSNGNKEGLSDDTGQLVIPMIYDQLGWSNGDRNPYNEVIGYREGNQWGIIALKNEKITDARYVHLRPEGTIIIASRKNQYSGRLLYGVLDWEGRVVLGFQYEALNPIGDYLIASQIREGAELWGVLDFQENQVIPLEFDMAEMNHLNVVLTRNGAKALYDKRGIPLTSFIYEDIEELGSMVKTTSTHGKHGLLSSIGETLVEPSFASVSVSSDSTALLSGFPTWEMILPGTGVIKEYQYDFIEPVNHGIYKVTANQHQAIINIEEEILLSGKGWEIEVLDYEFVMVSQGGARGILREGGIEVMPMEFDSIFYSGKHFYARSSINGNSIWQIYSQFGNLITSSSFQGLYPMTENLIASKKNGYWGYIDFAGHTVIEYKYDMAWPFYNDLAKVKYLGDEGVINFAGNWVIQPNHKEVTIIDADLFINHTEDRNELINSDEEILYYTQNDLSTHDGLVIESSMDGKYGLVNRYGKVLLTPTYDSISDLIGSRMFVVRKNDDHGVIRKDGSWIIPLSDHYSEIGLFSEDFLVVKKDGKYGFIDLDGNLRIANRYDDVHPFQLGMAGVKLLGKWGFIDKIERLVIQPKYEQVVPFENGQTLVKKDGRMGIINLAGEEILPLDYNLVVKQESGNYLLEEEGDMGLAASDGRLMISAKYEKLEDNGNGLFIVRQRGKYGVIDESGINIIPIVYEDMIYDKINGYYLGKRPPEEEVIKTR